MTLNDFAPLIQPSDEKIVVLLLGGIGGLQSGPNLLTELQQAHRPHLNALARKAACGLVYPVAPGITPGPGRALRGLLGWQGEHAPAWKNTLGLNACAVSSSPQCLSLCAAAEFATERCGESPADLVTAACARLLESDFLLVHYQAPELFGLQGGYYEKVKAIEEFDVLIPQIQELSPDVIAVCGDHSCPTVAAAITWHPVPLIIQSIKTRYDMVQTYDEIACSVGVLGALTPADLLPLLLAHAGRLAPSL